MLSLAGGVRVTVGLAGSGGGGGAERASFSGCFLWFLTGYRPPGATLPSSHAEAALIGGGRGVSVGITSFTLSLLACHGLSWSENILSRFPLVDPGLPDCPDL